MDHESLTFHSPLLAGIGRDDSQELATLLHQASDEARWISHGR